MSTSKQPGSQPTPPPRIDTLPEDVHKHLLSLMKQTDLAHLAQSCQTFQALTSPLLSRSFRCTSCQASLFHPRELHLPDVYSFRHPPPPPCGPTSRLPPRNFLQLRQRAPHESLAPLGMVLDEHRGAANFHVLRHLVQTIYKNERFPLAAEMQAVRALRCAGCGVFVGFRHEVNGEVGDFVHQDFVELVDGEGRVVTLAGEYVAQRGDVVRCGGCGRGLFERRDVLPWTHVLASSRLTDLDAYLEWDHSWAGAETAAQPAFFVKRLKGGKVRNVRMENCRQGDMEVADLFCECERQIGWKFVAERPRDGVLVNYDQVGRFGIIRNAVTPGDPRWPV